MQILPAIHEQWTVCISSPFKFRPYNVRLYGQTLHNIGEGFSSPLLAKYSRSVGTWFCLHHQERSKMLYKVTSSHCPCFSVEARAYLCSVTEKKKKNSSSWAVNTKCHGGKKWGQCCVYIESYVCLAEYDKQWVQRETAMLKRTNCFRRFNHQTANTAETF